MQHGLLFLTVCLQGLAPVETYDGVFYSVGLNTKTLTACRSWLCPSADAGFAPRRVAPEVMPIRFAPRGRGNAGADAPQPLCNKKAQGRSRRFTGITGIPAQMVLTVSLRALPGTGFFAPSLAGRTADLAPASGRRTTRLLVRDSTMSDARPRPSHPQPTFVTIAKRPSWSRGMRGKVLVICPTAQAYRMRHAARRANDAWVHAQTARRHRPSSRRVEPKAYLLSRRPRQDQYPSGAARVSERFQFFGRCLTSRPTLIVT